MGRLEEAALEPTDQGDDDEGVHCCGRDRQRRSLEGQWPHARFVVIEFPSREAAERWYGSPEYQKIIGLRHNSSVGNLIIAEGGVD